ncbi:MAG TPA: pentapeptide repeat-containing protein [Solirubrobacteraceae bacterium]
MHVAGKRRDEFGHVGVWLTIGLVIAGLFAAAFFVLPPTMVDTPEVPPTVADKERGKLELQATSQRDKLRNDVRTAALQGLAGLLVAMGAYLTVRQIRLSRHVHQTETFTSAIGHLREEELISRLGGIRALERLAASSRFDHDSATQMLTVFVRDVAAAGRTASAADREAVEAAMIALGRLNSGRSKDASRLNLAHTDLHGLILNETDLRRANFTGAILRGAQLFDADLRDGLFVGADLRTAALAGAKCAGANFEEAHLEGADTGAAKALDLRLAHCHPDRPHTRK